MEDKDKTKEQLIRELVEMRQQTAELEASKTKDTVKWLRALANNVTIGVYIVQDGKFRFTNSTFQELVGYSEVELIGMHSLSIVYTGDRDMVRENAVQRLKGESSFPYEFRYVNKGGECLWVMETVVSIQYQGRRRATLGNFMDITERKRAEEELITAQKYAHNLIDRSLDMIISVDQERRIVEFNLAAQKAFGYSKEEVLGRHVNLLYADPEEGSKAHETAKGTGQFTGEVVNRRKNGETFISYLAASALLNEKGEFLGVMGVSRDITERKRAEDILRESEEKLRLIFESVPEGIVVTDLGGKILDVNEGAVHMHGYDTKEELIGRKSFELVAEKDCARIMEDMKEIPEIGSTGVIRYSFVKKDGDEFPAAVSSAVLRDTNGQPAGFVVIAVDITEQKKMQEQIILTDRLASIGQLAAGIAHELNNPLTSVIGFSELLLEKDFPDDIREDLETIDKDAKRAASVVKGLLTFVRKQGTEKVSEDINIIIQEVLQLRSYEQRTSDIEVDTRFALDLPRVIANGAQMQQVFMNLIVNAQQAMLEAHGRGRLKVTTEEADDRIRVSIDDDGPGISPEDMKRLFTPFFT
ncbi:PAS domain S-box protein, partial [Chloroflexota bacterium]